MQLEFHQLDRRWEHLRVRQPHLQRRLLASLAEAGQQTPIVVVLSPDQRDRYLVIDGHKRGAPATGPGHSRSHRLDDERSRSSGAGPVAALQSAGKRAGTRLAVVGDGATPGLLEGKIAAQLAMKYLVPVARVSLEQCEQMAAAFVQHHCGARQAGQLYAAWRDGSRVVRERILAEPELFLKTQRQPPTTRPAATALERELEMAGPLHRAGRRLAAALPEMDGRRQEQAQRQIESARRELERMAARIGKEGETQHAESGTTNRDPGTECQERDPARDRTRTATLAPDCAQSAALKLQPGSGNPTGGESRTLPATDSGSVGFLQGESRASP